MSAHFRSIFWIVSGLAIVLTARSGVAVGGIAVVVIWSAVLQQEVSRQLSKRSAA